MPFHAFEIILDSNLNRIVSSLPSFFTSADFIKVAKDCFPGEYATILRNSNYRTLHSWIARWYLNRHFVQVGEREILTVMGHKSPNKRWRR